MDVQLDGWMNGGNSCFKELLSAVQKYGEGCCKIRCKMSKRIQYGLDENNCLNPLMSTSQILVKSRPNNFLEIDRYKTEKINLIDMILKNLLTTIFTLADIAEIPEKIIFSKDDCLQVGK
jgi:hypothetical protein